jgi:hypothetical protein
MFCSSKASTRAACSSSSISKAMAPRYSRTRAAWDWRASYRSGPMPPTDQDSRGCGSRSRTEITHPLRGSRRPLSREHFGGGDGGRLTRRESAVAFSRSGDIRAEDVSLFRKFFVTFSDRLKDTGLVSASIGLSRPKNLEGIKWSTLPNCPNRQSL